MRVKKLADEIMGMSQGRQMDKIFEILDKKRVPFEPKRKGGQFEGAYRLDNGVVITKMRVKIPETGKEGLLPVIMDSDIYDKHIADGKANVRIEWRSDGKPRVVVEGHGRDENGAAPRFWLSHLVTGREAYSSQCVDHIRSNTLINLRKELRLCSIGENNRNSVNRAGTGKELAPDAGQYTYSPARDCRYTLYAYVLMLLGIIADDELSEVNKVANANGDKIRRWQSERDGDTETCK